MLGNLYTLSDEKFCMNYFPDFLIIQHSDFLHLHDDWTAYFNVKMEDFEIILHNEMFFKSNPFLLSALLNLCCP